MCCVLCEAILSDQPLTRCMEIHSWAGWERPAQASCPEHPAPADAWKTPCLLLHATGVCGYLLHRIIMATHNGYRVSESCFMKTNHGISRSSARTFALALNDPGPVFWCFLFFWTNTGRIFTKTKLLCRATLRVQVYLSTFRDPPLPRVISYMALCTSAEPEVAFSAFHYVPWGPDITTHRWERLTPTLEAVGHSSEDIFPQTEKSLTTLNPLNDAKNPPSFQQIPRVPGRNYLMQLRR